MAGQSHMTNALLTEHFRQTPLSLLDEIINTVNELVFKAVDRLEEALSNAPATVLGYDLPAEQAADLDDTTYETALTDHKQKEIDVGIVQLESLLNAIVDKDFDKFEIYVLRNILAIGHQEDIDLAQWICLDHYRDLKIEPTGQQVTPEAVQLQRRKRHETAKLNLMLKEEQARNAAVIEQLSATLTNGAPLGFLAATSPPASAQTSEDMAQLVLQLPRIQQCLAELKSALSRPMSSTRPNDDSSIVKRRRYLDTQAMKALEQRGLSIEKPGQNLLSGRCVGKDDVEGLEAVVQALGGASHVPD